MTDTHLTPEEVAAFVDKTLQADEEARVTDHLSRCGTCRMEVADVARVNATAPSAPRRNPVRPGAIAVVAAAVLVLAASLTTLRARPDSLERSTRPAAGGGGMVRTVSPRPGDTMHTSSPRLTWRADGAASYQVRIVDSAGSVVWSATTSDTAIAVPETAGLARGSRYFWYVDALRADGYSTSSGPQPFVTAP